MQFVQVCFDARRYQEAIATFESLRSIEGTTMTALYLAASHAALGHAEKATRIIDRVLQNDPSSSVAKWTQIKFAPYKEQKDIDHLRNHLLKAGLPV
jgi:tetratricopeptide (TPR) repeat protein